MSHNKQVFESSSYAEDPGCLQEQLRDIGLYKATTNAGKPKIKSL